MGEKRKREEEEDGEGPHGGRPPRPYSGLDAETLSFYQEIAGHLKTLDSDEDRQLLADNVLEEAAARAADVATDAACSRVLESLLPHASTERLCAFVAACVEGDSLATVCTSGPFGSHVLEKALLALAGRAAAAAGQADYELIEGALGSATEAIAGSLYDVVTSKYGSFVARRLLCILSGREVAPAPSKKSQQQQQPLEGMDAGPGAAEPQPRHASGRPAVAGGGSLAAKLGTSGRGGGEDLSSQQAPYPELLDLLASVVLTDDWSGPAMRELQQDPFASPFLQALLRACQGGDPAMQQRLVLQVLGVSSLDGLTADGLHRLLQDRSASHLMEAVFQTAPDDLFQRLCTLSFKGHLVPLAQHPTANFGVQAALAALRKPQQLKRMFEDLRPHLGALLRMRRAGVVAALLAATGRLRALEADVVAAVWHAAGGLAGSSGGPLEALLALDTTAQLDPGSSGRVRLSTLGCAMLQALFRLPPAAVKQWSEALVGLVPGVAQHVARDPGGCRVLEAYLEGPGAVPKKRRALLQALEGSWAAIAMGGSGSHFVERCYMLADAAEKEAITAELARAETQLAATHRGPVLLRRCHVQEYRQGSEGWQKRVAAADAVRRDFVELFDAAGGGEGGAAEGAGAAAEGAAAAEELEGGAEEEEPAVQPVPEGDASGRKKKAKKHRGGEQLQEAAGVAAAAVSGRGKKQRKKHQELGLQQVGAVSAGVGAAENGGAPTKTKKHREEAAAAVAASEGEERRQEKRQKKQKEGQQLATGA